MPLGSKAALRVAGIWHQRDGIWHNLDTDDEEYGDEDRHSFRADAGLQAIPATDLHVVERIRARSNGEAQPQKMARRARAAFGREQTALRINDLLPFAGNIDWEHGVLNTAGNAPAVNIENFDRLTTRWQDVWNGGSQRADLEVDGGYLKITHDFGAPRSPPSPPTTRRTASTKRTTPAMETCRVRAHPA